MLTLIALAEFWGSLQTDVQRQLKNLHWLKEFVFKTNPRLQLVEIIAVALVVAFASEVIFPKLNSRCISDWYDVYAYTAGTCVYLFANSFQNIFDKR